MHAQDHAFPMQRSITSGSITARCSGTTHCCTIDVASYLGRIALFGVVDSTKLCRSCAGGLARHKISVLIAVGSYSVYDDDARTKHIFQST